MSMKGPSMTPTYSILGFLCWESATVFTLIVKHFGGVVSKEKLREDGQFEVTLDTSCPLFADISRSEKVLLTHGDSVTAVSSCFSFSLSPSFSLSRCLTVLKLWGGQEIW